MAEEGSETPDDGPMKACCAGMERMQEMMSDPCARACLEAMQSSEGHCCRPQPETEPGRREDRANGERGAVDTSNAT